MQKTQFWWKTIYTENYLQYLSGLFGFLHTEQKTEKKVDV